MRTRIRKWGNSLAVRVPKAFVKETRLSYGSEVDMTLDDGKIVLEPVSASPPSLSELLDGVDEDNIHEEIDAGQPVGREAW